MALDRLDWDKLKVFRIVSESGSISAAARRLGESPPTVSRKIDELEKALNASLFTRSTRGIEMTDAGKKALIHAEVMAEAASALKNEVADIDMPAEGAVTLVCGDGLGAHWIAPHLPAFQRAHPGIRLQMRITDAIPDPMASDSDITVQFSEPRRQDLISRKLGTLHYMCFSSRAYLDLYGQPTSVFDFHSHRVIFHDGYVNQVEKWPGKTADLTKVIDYALVTNSGAVMMAVCAGGGGIAVLPSYVSALDDRLVPLELPEVVPAAFWITYSERMRRLQRGQVVIEWLRTMFDQRKHVWFRNTFHHPNSLTKEEKTAPPSLPLMPQDAPEHEEL